MSTEVRGVVIVGPECKGCGSGMEDTCRRWWPDCDEYFFSHSKYRVSVWIF